jgi:hypothetical protein
MLTSSRDGRKSLAILGGNVMHFIKRRAIAAAASICFIGPAMAAEMTGAEIKDLIAGKTLYNEATAASASGAAGQTVLYYAADGSVLFKTAKGAIWHGTWTIKGNLICNEWKEAPNTQCRKYDKQGDTITVLNSETGQTVAKIVKAAPGNAEKLAP